jgi:hypothetical protein
MGGVPLTSDQWLAMSMIPTTTGQQHCMVKIFFFIYVKHRSIEKANTSQNV